MIEWYLTNYGYSARWEDIRFTIEIRSVPPNDHYLLEVSVLGKHASSGSGYLAKDNTLGWEYQARIFSSPEEAKDAAERWLKIRTLL